MTAMTSNVGSNQVSRFGGIQEYVVGAAVHIYRGALVVVRLTDGYAYPALEDVSDTYKQLIVGWALEEMDNSSGDAGDKIVRVRRDGKLGITWITTTEQSLVGQLACVKDDQTAQGYGASTGKTVIGRITSLKSSIEVFVDFTDRPKRISTSIYD